MKAVKKLSDYLALPAWKLLYDKHVNKYLKNIIQETDTRPYKVYTALLTQSGGDGPSVINGDEAIPLTIGVTYEIVDNTGLDVTNVGSPNNNIGTKFVATGTTPNSWGNIDGWGLLGYNTGAPVVTVLENTIGDIYWTYNSTGNYLMNSYSLFTDSKTFFLLGCQTQNAPNNIYFQMYRNSTSNYTLTSMDEGDSADDIFYNSPIEIRVYS